MQTATDDVTVSPVGARELHRALVPRYAAAPERLRYLEHRGEGHMFSEPAWDLAWRETLAWFDRHLRASS
jgi:dipeptidyl aminopeptidase/acylaminoacyl peptidase